MSDDRTAEDRGSAPAPDRPPRLPEADRYRPIGRLGAGGMGEVWRVYDRRLERTLAMKVLHPALAGDPVARARFRDEVRLTAGLAHPSIVVVFDAGEDDGRLWYTLQEVERGRTLRAALAERSDDPPWRSAPLRALRAVAEAVAYAHARGVLHRDLKPGNVLVGAHDQVLVLDWGVARRGPHAEGRSGPEGGPARERPPAGPGGTTAGRLLGTPPYCPPEQALGHPADHGPASDVYALGAMLHELLVGAPPFDGRADRMFEAFARGDRTPPLRARAGQLPEPLVELADAALAHAPGERSVDARGFAERLGRWEEDVRRRERALAALARADALVPAVTARRAESAALRLEAAAAEVPPHAPEPAKWPVWDLEDAAALAEAEVAALEVREEQALRTALDHDPRLDRAHQRLADLFRARADRAMARGDATAATWATAEVRTHDRGGQARWLSGEAALTLHTDPPGAEATLHRVVERRRRRVLEPVGALGPTPLDARSLPTGSWVVRLTAPGCVPVDYPVVLGREGSWDGRPPGEASPVAVRLPREGELGPDDRYVAAGWCLVGGDPLATDPLPAGRRWVDAFVIRRHPVTVAEYCAFLDAIAARAPEEARRLAPMQTAGASSHPVLAPGPDGRFVPVPDADGVTWGRRWPVTLVDWYACTAFAAWEAKRTGQPWRLPHEIEWEKAARGVDGRMLPWGDHFEPTWANTPVSRPDGAGRVDVDAYPLDESPYGVRGMVGNTRDRCLNLYRRLPEPDPRVRPVAPPPGEAGLRVTRGGAWLASPALCRPAGRFADPPDRRISSAGLRLARSLPDAHTERPR